MHTRARRSERRRGSPVSLLPGSPSSFFSSLAFTRALRECLPAAPGEREASGPREQPAKTTRREKKRRGETPAARAREPSIRSARASFALVVFVARLEQRIFLAADHADPSCAPPRPPRLASLLFNLRAAPPLRLFPPSFLSSSSSAAFFFGARRPCAPARRRVRARASRNSR